MEPISRQLPGAHGLELHALEWSREGVPLLLLHGFGNDAHVWDDFAPRVAPYYRTLALDLRGHGDSAHDPERRYDYDFHVEDLECACRAAGVERLVLVGHSFGGRVATLFAGQHPERMAGLVIVDSGPEVDARGATRIVQDTVRQRDIDFSSPAEYERALSLAYPAAAPEVLARLARHGLRRRPDGRFVRKTDPGFHDGRRDASPEAQRAHEETSSRRLWQALEKIACPTLVVRGAASDILSPDCADRMVEEALPNGRLAVVARASHSVMIDHPAGFADAVLGFVLGEE